MKTLTLRAIKQPLALEDRPKLKPSAGEVVVRLKAAALNRRDFWITQGMYPNIEPPVVLGSDGAGVVARAGEAVAAEWLGRQVVINPGWRWGENAAAQSREFTILGLPHDGTFATEVVVPVEQLHEKPAHLDWIQAAALPLAGVTAWRALFTQGGLRAGETVLITGVGGGVATCALQWAVAARANVWVTSSSSEKIGRAVALGARGGFVYTDDQWAKALAREAGAPSLIVDSAGGAGYQHLIDLAAPGGRLVNYGATAGAPERLDLFKVFWKQLRLQGTTMGSPDDFTNMLRFVSERKLAPVVDRVWPLSAGNEALEQMRVSPQFGKYVLDTESDD